MTSPIGGPPNWSRRLEKRILTQHGVAEGEPVPEATHSLILDVQRLLEQELHRHIELAPALPFQHRLYRVAGVPGSRRGGQVGELIATLGLKHASGSVVVLRFADGALDSFGPLDIFPHLEEA